MSRKYKDCGTFDQLWTDILSIGDAKAGNGNSFTDRLNCQITTIILLIFALIIFILEHYVGAPVHCWHPPHFTESHENYTNNICWVKNTYLLSFDKRIPGEKEKHQYIYYYQWINFILIIQALCFNVPRVLWDVVSRSSGVAVTTITDTALELENAVDSVERERLSRYMANHLMNFLKHSEIDCIEEKGYLLKCRSVLHGNTLTFYYLLSKFLYILNIIAQIFMLSSTLGFQFYKLGLDTLKRLASKQEVNVLHRFPRETLCDFEVRLHGNVNRYTVQCILPMNLYAEMIFTVLWFWFIVVGFFTSCSFVIWTWEFSYEFNRIRYTMTHLNASKANSDTIIPNTVSVRLFLRNFLLRDGLLIVELVGKTTSSMVASELISSMWKKYINLINPSIIIENHNFQLESLPAMLTNYHLG